MIKVGAATEVEMKEKKARVEDALHATRAAVEEGIVAGGGVAYLRARASLKTLKGDNADQDAGIKIVLRALEEPMRRSSRTPVKSRRVVRQQGRRRQGQLRLQRADRPVRRPGRDGCPRSDQGDALCAAERGVRREPDADDRRDDCRAAEGRQARWAAVAVVAWAAWATWTCKWSAPERQKEPALLRALFLGGRQFRSLGSQRHFRPVESTAERSGRGPSRSAQRRRRARRSSLAADAPRRSVTRGSAQDGGRPLERHRGERPGRGPGRFPLHAARYALD